MRDATGFITGMVIAGSIFIGSNCVSCELSDQSDTLKYVNRNIGQLENALRETLKERPTFTGTPEEKQIDGKAYMCVPREDYIGR